jgi:hypothetical protein
LALLFAELSDEDERSVAAAGMAPLYDMAVAATALPLRGTSPCFDHETFHGIAEKQATFARGFASRVSMSRLVMSTLSGVPSGTANVHPTFFGSGNLFDVDQFTVKSWRGAVHGAARPRPGPPA